MLKERKVYVPKDEKLRTEVISVRTRGTIPDLPQRV